MREVASRRVAAGAGLVGFALAVPWLLGGYNYVVYLLNLAMVYSIAALGLNLLLGVAGQVSIGHAGFMAVGAYTSALLVTKAHWPFLAAAVAAVLLACLIGVVVGLPALRLSGFYLAIATMAFGIVMAQLPANLDALTGGPQGIRGIPAPAIGPLAFNTPRRFYYLALGAMALSVWMAANLLQSRTGRAMLALRDSELAAQALGIHISRYKSLAFVISAGLTAAAGALYAHLVGFISPADFNLMLSLELMAMIVIGGLGSVWGGLAGALFMTFVPRLFARTESAMAVFMGVAVIVAVLALPGGLVGLTAQAASRWARQRQRFSAPAGGRDAMRAPAPRERT